MNTVITDVQAREVLDSRANPTVEAEVHLAGGTTLGVVEAWILDRLASDP